MKKIFSILTLAAMLFSVQAFAQLDRSKAPAPGPAPKVEMGTYEKFTMPNGLRVIVVNNDVRPVVNVTLNFLTDDQYEGDKAGLSSIFGDLWGKGTKKRTVNEINDYTDFIGASFWTGAKSIGFYSLSKYTDPMFELMSDVLMNPVFPQSEYDKLKTQIESGLEASKTSPSTIMDNMQATTIYGEGHPYGDVMTIETVENVSIDDCKEFHKTFIKPNNAIMIVVGDITADQVKALVKKYFKKWKKGEVPQFEARPVVKPQGINVVFSAKDAAVQSSIDLTYPIDLKPGDKDELAAKIANYIYGGGGFSAKLMKNLREDKGYTYGAYSSISSSEICGNFSASGEVNKDATDSSFIEMVKEMNAMLAGDYDDKDFQRAKAAYAGSFSRALESPATVAGYAYAIEKYGLPEDYYATYLQRLDALTKEDVQNAVKKYFDVNNLYYFVVGDESLIPALEKIDSDGKVLELDYLGKPVVKKEVSSDVTVESVLAKYIDYIGGAEAVNSVKDLTMTVEMPVQGMVMVTDMKIIAGKAMSMSQSVMGNVMANIKYTGDKVEIVSPQGNQTVEDPAVLAGFADQVYPFIEAKEGVVAELSGIEQVNGKDAYKVKIAGGYRFYDVETGALVKAVAVQEGAAQEILYSDYQKTDAGILYPMVQTTSVMGMTMEGKITKLAFNTGLTLETL